VTILCFCNIAGAMLLCSCVCVFQMHFTNVREHCRYMLMTCPAGCTKLEPPEEMASAVYNEAVKVPFMAKFLVFARRTSPMEGQLRIFCLTDDVDLPTTFSEEEGFVEVARSADVEVGS